jgi:pimeloyl-ACP methyl ester carboxylesterase
VTRLALVDTTARPDTEEATSRRRGFIELARKGKFKGVTPRLLPTLLSERHQHDAALTERVYAMAERIGRDGFIQQQHAIMARPDSRPLLPEIAVPTLVACGREDALTPPERAEEMAAAVPDADLLVLSGAGHLAPMERPRALTHAMRQWLTRPPERGDRAGSP